MKEGSIVVMKRGMSHKDVNTIMAQGVKNYPRPSSTPIVITYVGSSNNLPSKIGVTLDLYPEIGKIGLMDISLFEEIMPPDPIFMQSIVEMQQPVY